MKSGSIIIDKCYLSLSYLYYLISNYLNNYLKYYLKFYSKFLINYFFNRLILTFGRKY